MEQARAATREELTARCGHECLNRPDHDGPHFYGYIGGRYSYEGILAELDRVRDALRSTWDALNEGVIDRDDAIEDLRALSLWLDGKAEAP